MIQAQFATATFMKRIHALLPAPSTATKIPPHRHTPRNTATKFESIGEAPVSDTLGDVSDAAYILQYAAMRGANGKDFDIRELVK